MAHRGQDPSRSPPTFGSPSRSKKNSASLFDCFQDLWRSCPPVHSQRRLDQRAQTLALSSLLCLGRRTVTGLISTSGQQFADWSAAYRLFSRDRVSIDHLFTGVRDSVVNLIPPSRPVCLALDDSLFRRTGTKIPGVGWRRDPLGPKFHTNFIRAQRFLQISVAVPTIEHTDIMRMIPVDFLHCPSVPKPGHRASEEQFKQYRRECKAMSL